MDRNVSTDHGKSRKFLDVDVTEDFVVVLDVEPYELHVAALGRNALEGFAEFPAGVAPGRAQRDHDQGSVRVPA